MQCLERPRLPEFNGQEDSPDCPKFRVSKRDSLRLSPDALRAPDVVLTASVRSLSIVSQGAGGVTELQAWTEFHSLIVSPSHRGPRPSEVRIAGLQQRAVQGMGKGKRWSGVLPRGTKTPTFQGSHCLSPPSSVFPSTQPKEQQALHQPQ